MKFPQLILVVAFTALAPTVANAQFVTFDKANRTVTPEMQPLSVHVGGRVIAQPLHPPMPNGAARFRHEWPGVYFEAAFRGDRVVLKFDDLANEYRLIIDNRPPLTFAQPGTVEVTVGELGEGIHNLRLEKVTESIGLPEAFDGFYIPSTATPLIVQPRARQIEFIGDSGMAGYGSRSSTRQCTKEEVRLLTDTQASYVTLTARHFDADYQINAISGRGMIRNYGGDSPDAPMPALYDRALFSQEGEWQDESWQPQIVVIGLAGGDFSSPLNPGEQWASEDELVAAYVAGYERFLTELHRRSPDAAILVIWPVAAEQPDEQSAAKVEAVKNSIIASARTVGIKTILFPELTDLGFDQGACDYHSSLADHRKLADWMTAYLEARPELWQGK